MSAEETNVPIKVDEEGFDRLEITSLRGFQCLDVPGAGIRRGGPSVKDPDLLSKKATSKGTLAKPALKTKLPQLPHATPSVSKMSSILETHDSEPTALQNLKTLEENKSLKRKCDDGHSDYMRNVYGYVGTPVSRSVVGCNHSASAKRYRRRNSFMIHPRHGRGGPFPGINNAIEAALRETRRQQPTDRLELGDTPRQESPTTIHSHCRSTDSKNASGDGNGVAKEKSDDKDIK